jgi:membrane associated rhomboid family serine protease
LFPLKDENPTKRRPIVTYSLIIINTAIFVWSLVVGKFDQMIIEFGMKPGEVLRGLHLYTLFTSMFLHGGVLHILSNMWYLWIFGDNIEDVLGRGKFILFYLGAGLAAGLAHVLSNPSSMIPTIGASGAIAGVLGAYMILYPWASVHTAVIFFYLIRLITIPALAMIGFWFVLQILSASVTWMTGVSGGVAYWAHIGGFIAGVILILPVWVKLRRRGRARYRYTSEYGVS